MPGQAKMYLRTNRVTQLYAGNAIWCAKHARGRKVSATRCDDLNKLDSQAADILETQFPDLQPCELKVGISTLSEIPEVIS